MAPPENVGIKALELYFPAQVELEKHDGVSEGKYTIGLGQTRMSFCDDREDIYSLALTAVSSLLRKYNIDPKSIGRLEVGTETILDKSKSVKSVLMQLFEESGNTSIEGVDSLHACYGGTNALFNAINWVESSAWDGRNAIVVAGDIAIYKKGAARPSGGAGCAAMLVGPDAPLAFDPGLRGVYISHTYDFYKPDLTSEYPVVDGHYSLRCYSEALDKCYQDYTRKEKLRQGPNGTNGVNGHANGHAASESEAPLDRFDYMCFHSPTCKTVQKSYARLLFNDYLADSSLPIFQDVPESLKGLDYQASLIEKTVEKTFMGLTKKRFSKRVQPATIVPTQCGNMYCASVFSGLASLLGHVPAEELAGKKVGIFSFGSGLASSLYSLRIRDAAGAADIATKLDLPARLAARKVVSPQEYDNALLSREKAHLQKSFEPRGDTSSVVPGAYYLTGIDDMFRRTYKFQA